MRVIDADSHFVEPLDWVKRVDPALSRRLGEEMSVQEFLERMTVGLVSEMFTGLPASLRPSAKELAPNGLGPILDTLGFEVTTDAPDRKIPLSEFQQLLGASPLGEQLWPEGAFDPEERIRFCDARGIDLQFVNPTFLVTTLRRVREEQPELAVPVVQAYNDWAAEVYRGRLDRFIPVTYLLVEDVAWACSELRRMREKGSRAFVFSFIPAHGRSIADPSFDPIWRTAVETGMIPFLHVGVARSQIDPSWASAHGKLDHRVAIRLIFNENHVYPQTVLSGLILGGVFDRHPELTVICQEFGTSWLNSWAEGVGFKRFEGIFEALFGAWPYQRELREYLGRNIRVSSLPADRVDRVIQDFGENVAVFATDYPHPEGAESAKRDFEALFDREQVPTSARARFFGGNVDELLLD